MAPAGEVAARVAARAGAAALLWLLAACDRPWMAAGTALPDGTTVLLEHRADGRFRTTVRNAGGAAVTEQPPGPDERRATLYRSPAGRVIVADAGMLPVVFDADVRGAPRLAAAAGVGREYAAAARWRYLGTVRRTGNRLDFYPHDPECGEWSMPSPPAPSRRLQPCRTR